MTEPLLRPDLRKLTWGVLGTLGGVSLIVFALLGLMFGDPQSDPLPEKARPDHAAIRAELDAQAQERLDGYGWVDQGKGIVHIPVDVAAQRWLEERGAGK